MECIHRYYNHMGSVCRYFKRLHKELLSYQKIMKNNCTVGRPFIQVICWKPFLNCCRNTYWCTSTWDSIVARYNVMFFECKERRAYNFKTPMDISGFSHWWTDGWMDGRTLPSALSPYFTVNNKHEQFYLHAFLIKQTFEITGQHGSWNNRSQS